LNYQGLYQQFEREDSLFQRCDAPNGQDLDVSLQGARFATFVVSIAVVNGKAMVTFMYNNQIRQPDNYWVRSAFQVTPTTGKSRVSVARIQRAWQSVVMRHAALRTAFTMDLPGLHEPAQIVLKNRKAGLKHIQVKNATSTADLFKGHVTASETQRNGLGHHLTLYELQDGSI
jgi:hypothetical protein